MDIAVHKKGPDAFRCQEKPGNSKPRIIETGLDLTGTTGDHGYALVSGSLYRGTSPVVLLRLFLMAGVIFFLASCNDSSNTHSEAYYYPIVVSEFNKISNFPNVKIDNSSNGEKYGGAWSTARFSTRASQFSIDDYYDKELANIGWKRHAIRKSWAFLEGREYCKGKINLALELRKSKSEPDTIDVDISVFWSKGEEDNCQDDNQ